MKNSSRLITRKQGKLATLESDRPIWKKYFQSSWTKDTIDGGIDEEVFAASKE
ncbi:MULTISPECIES: hypothetical protein [Nostoc]|uniref:Uncharacterized protein n=1 Tax=Nostoc flagelliforme CCNUN1 TaxID=2038116 RepID=A0A2K8SUY6_9NOSO|nr:MULTISPECIES: hypothetical protein [Nostoc]AUB39153.1 hypothetical protein COO91_05145 [Nostoc flagelliforme CCNUN1]MCC5629212.1 hypothetical protein [Nostoc sphaeroides CHAB 2801]